MIESSRAMGEAVISEGMRSMHRSCRQTWLPTAPASSRKAFSPASPPSSSPSCGV